MRRLKTSSQIVFGMLSLCLISSFFTRSIRSHNSEASELYYYVHRYLIWCYVGQVVFIMHPMSFTVRCAFIFFLVGTAPKNVNEYHAANPIHNSKAILTCFTKFIAEQSETGWPMYDLKVKGLYAFFSSLISVLRYFWDTWDWLWVSFLSSRWIMAYTPILDCYIRSFRI